MDEQSPRKIWENMQDHFAELRALAEIRKHLGIPRDATEREARITIEEWALQHRLVERGDPDYMPLRLLERAKVRGAFSSGGKQQGRDREIEKIKREIREWRAAKLTHREICARLGNRPRPKNAAWAAAESWSAAYRKNRPSVSKWISSVSPPRQPVR
ncbi:MAG: hypothetical protein KIT09_02620 [Bryobacteraceae bacterium]|nr:hypothetical protein [Bryobacteraceae bacterium]